jgi:hypothetical protein
MQKPLIKLIGAESAFTGCAQLRELPRKRRDSREALVVVVVAKAVPAYAYAFDAGLVCATEDVINILV